MHQGMYVSCIHVQQGDNSLLFRETCSTAPVKQGETVKHRRFVPAWGRSVPLGFGSAMLSTQLGSVV